MNRAYPFLLKDINFAVILSLDTESVFLQETRNTNIDAETDLGILMNDISEEDSGMPKKLLQTIGNQVIPLSLGQFW